MMGYFADEQSYAAALALQDVVLYEVYEIRRPEIAGELLHGISIVHPGKIGDEYFMTKGHFHAVLYTAEIYYCLQGQGYMVMETPEGECEVQALHPGVVLYVPPRWAHRSINSGQTDLATLFVYPGNAGHDYGSIAGQGFRKRIIERDGVSQIIDNTRWRSRE
jgi:glucose-6-phosphate isomerase